MIQKDQQLSLTAAQMRAGRALLGMSQAEVAKAAGISIPTLKRAESESGISVSLEAKQLIQCALCEAGLDFIWEGSAGVGVRLRKSNRSR
jgi:transcriptional regulator with XRE-family HTH domain